MYIYFGIVKIYSSERGFGFLKHPISLGPKDDVFYHIKNVTKSREDIAERLINNVDVNRICFWYIAESTQKGEQLQSILKAEEVFNLQQEDPSFFKNKIETIWERTDKSLPFWIDKVTIGLFGIEGLEKLSKNRELIIQQKKEEEEIQRIEKERLKAIREEKERIEREKREEERKKAQEIIRKREEKRKEERKREEESRRKQEKIEEEEFELLVAEMESKNFTQSAQVSYYIIKHRLGEKYQNISGILEMENGHSSWKFNGGFPPKIYARLCDRLNLGNKGTRSKVTGFTSFKDLK